MEIEYDDEEPKTFHCPHCGAINWLTVRVSVSESGDIVPETCTKCDGRVLVVDGDGEQ